MCVIYEAKWCVHSAWRLCAVFFALGNKGDNVLQCLRLISVLYRDVDPCDLLLQLVQQLVGLEDVEPEVGLQAAARCDLGSDLLGLVLDLKHLRNCFENEVLHIQGRRRGGGRVVAESARVKKGPATRGVDGGCALSGGR